MADGVKFYTIYMVTNIITNKIYIGMHQTNNLDDGYYGSGLHIQRSLHKYGVEKHKKEIIKLCSSREEMIDLEKTIVNEDFVKDSMTMNICLGGKGGGWTIEQQKENNRRSQLQIKWLWKNDKEWAERFSKKKSEINRKAYLEGKRVPTLKPHPKGHKMSEETKLKVSKAKKGKCSGTNNSQYGKRWVCNLSTFENKHIPQHELNKWVSQGWTKGKVLPNTKINICVVCDTNIKAKRKNHNVCSRQCGFDRTKQKTDIKEKDNIKLVSNSDIDFSSYGWCAKVATLINKDVMYVKRWMIRHLPDFYEQNCYKRNK